MKAPEVQPSTRIAPLTLDVSLSFEILCPTCSVGTQISRWIQETHSELINVPISQEEAMITRTKWLSTLTVCIALAVGLLAIPAQAAPGDLDPSFGTGGKVKTDFGPGSNSATAIAIQADSKIVVVGGTGSGDFALARYNADGSLDASFGIGGKVTTDIGLFDVAFAVAIQADGKIVAAGGTAPEGFCCQFALARYNTDGSLDASFGVGGKVTTIFAGDSRAFAVAIQADGKIVAAGGRSDPFVTDFALARYNADGSLDTSFGTGGKVTTDFSGFDQASRVAVQEDDKIVAVGTGGPNNDFALTRYNTDGSLDTSFGTGGKVTTDFGGFDGASGLAIQGDAKIIAAGRGGFFTVFALARYNTDGSLDTTFDGDGMVTTQFFGENIESAAGVAIQTNGKIVVAGSVFSTFDPSFALARYNINGSLDTSFGAGGKVTTDFGDPSEVGVLCPSARKDCSEDTAKNVAIQSDGKIVAVGGAGPCTPPCIFALARYLGDPTATSVPFSAFHAKLKLALRAGANDDAFEMEARFTLGAHSNGINPLTEDVNLKIGTFSTTLPAGSFIEVTKRRFEFQSVINGVAFEAEIQSLSHNRFLIKMERRRADLTGTVNPVPVTLTIGNDTGSTSVVAKFK
jgi:uncharacterized delta-60 repeat protein